LYSIVIEGHTDDAPIKNEIFRSNWDLSAARAATVAMMFQDKNYDMKKLSVRAFGEFKPALPNRDANGVPILENRNKNRRIVIRLVSLGLSEK
jgi:chemotaxis protein MotB